MPYVKLGQNAFTPFCAASGSPVNEIIIRTIPCKYRGLTR